MNENERKKKIKKKGRKKERDLYYLNYRKTVIF